ncbi:hypothetical protein [Marinobacter halophilus]|uniref:Asparagine synthetase domain-containing protein n=1 Tax=Marinobacter halophilus TaxID=1323740 RepID=A0A2T1K9M3_9GAMM|nr:hypothetical protein [Marinobacter halophilus]PSF06473.1 hypothetical protein C7H08_15305 [Marinobacter halophilus]GGC72885.1 hypothetical protein GCM10011362_21750 [Marinobacter halophilus]
MAVFTIEDVSETVTKVAAECAERTHFTVNSQWGIRFEGTMATRTDLEKWIFIWYGESNVEPDFKRVVDLIESGHFAELWGFRGVLIAISKVDGCIYVFNDAYGSFPVYVNSSRREGEPIVSDSMRCFAGHNVDWVSFYQFLSLGYIFGGNSLFDGVSRLKANCGLKLAYVNEKPVISRFPLKNFWNGSGTASTDDLIDIFRAEAEGFEDTQIMMSGGWDSRLLLTVLEHKKPLLYTHGNLQSRETAIVRDIASVCGLPLVERGFDPVDFGVEIFSSYLRKNESAMFTHWNPAGLQAAQKKLLMTAGTFGEVLGGHYGTLNTLPGKKKYASLLMHMVGAGALLDSVLHLHDRQTILSYLRMSNYRVLWFVESQLAENLRSRDLVEQSNQRVRALFESYEEQGMEDAQAMFERFYTEHRGGQYINRQLTNAAQGNRFRNIFTNRELLAAASSIPFSQRAHNKINKEIIKKLNPKLLDFPLAATLANARRPLLVQESSRAFRKLVEKNTVMLPLYQKFSRYGDRSFGWNSFRDIVSQELMEKVSPLLSDKIWNHQKLNEAVKSDNSSNMYPLFDMISKAITIDYIIRE